jgi:hypothetical protein
MYPAKQWHQCSTDFIQSPTLLIIMDSKSLLHDLELDEAKSKSSATDLHPVAKDEHERSAQQAETPATGTPKTNWAWAESSGHFDWMDWHTPSTPPGPH